MEPSDPRGWSLPFAERVRAASRHHFPAPAGTLWRGQAAGHPRGGMGPVQRKGAELHPGGCSPRGSRAQGGAGSGPAAVGGTELEHPHPEWGGGTPAVSGVSAQVSGGGSRGAKVGCRRCRTRPGWDQDPRFLAETQAISRAGLGSGLSGGGSRGWAGCTRLSGWALGKEASCPAWVLPAVSLCGRCASHMRSAGQ